MSFFSESDVAKLAQLVDGWDISRRQFDQFASHYFENLRNLCVTAATELNRQFAPIGKLSANVSEIHKERSKLNFWISVGESGYCGGTRFQFDYAQSPRDMNILWVGEYSYEPWFQAVVILNKAKSGLSFEISKREQWVTELSGDEAGSLDGKKLVVKFFNMEIAHATKRFSR